MIYASGDPGNVYVYTTDGNETHVGQLTGLNADGDNVVWKSHGDFAISPDNGRLYQVGYYNSMETSHSLLMMDVNDITNAVLIGEIPVTYGRVWGMAFDNDTGTLFAVTGASYMIEIDPLSGDILWSAPIVDGNDQAVALWDLASFTTPVPEPSSALLVGLVGIWGLLRRRRVV